MRFSLAVLFLAACAHAPLTQHAVVLKPKPIVAPPDVKPLPGEPLALGGDAASADFAPAPISGGTVLLTAKHAWVSNPDAGVVDVVDLDTKKLAKTFHLGKGTLPGRLAERSDGAVAVVLRGEGTIATMSVDAKTIPRRKACPDPRGIAADKDALLVACATGELVSLPNDGGEARTTQLGRDLRDVVLDRSGTAYVTRFRRADILVVDRTGKLVRTLRPAETDDRFDRREKIPARFMAHVAWRAIPAPDGSVFVLHQYETTRDIPIGMEPSKDETERSAPYGGSTDAFDPCGNGHLVVPAITRVENGAIKGTLRLTTDPAVDIARARSGGLVLVHPGGKTSQVALVADGPTCGAGPDAAIPAEIETKGISVAIAASDRGIAVQSRDPDELTVVSGADTFVVPLTASKNHDAGHAIFHTATSAGIACMSCHPEGGEDGHTWAFRGVGPRRTQTLRGGLLATAPFHWDGEMKGMSVLARDVFTRRMGGAALSDPQVDALGKWLDRLPAPPAPIADKTAIARGHAVFLQSGCNGCHDGPGQAEDVGTRGVFQVPSLAGVGGRAPYMHDGCAPTLMDRFAYPDCGGTKHGTVAPKDRADLVSYLESL